MTRESQRTAGRRETAATQAMEQMKITGKFVSLDDIIDPHGSNRGSMSDEED